MPAFLPAQEYRPQLPESEWVEISMYVTTTVASVHRGLTYPVEALLNAVTHHVDWCHNIAGLPLETTALFRRDVIGAAVAVMPTTSTSTMGRRRSMLLRVGETLGVIPVPPPLPPLAAALPSAPYSLQEVTDLWGWADLQSSRKVRASALALLSLGIGAGLTSRELCTVRAVDVLDDGAAVVAGGQERRVVPVVDDWQEDLAIVARLALDPGGSLFQPGIAFHKNIVANFVQRTRGWQIKPTVQRMRVTWLVRHLTEGCPIQDLLAWSGLKSMDALVRYQRFFPPPIQVDAGGTSATPQTR